MDRSIILLAMLFLMSPVVADPYSELAALPAQTSIALGFDVNTNLLYGILPHGEDNLQPRSMDGVLWKHIEQQERLVGWLTLVGEGYVFELEVDSPQEIIESAKKFVDETPSWDPDNGGFKDYGNRLDVDLERGRIRFGDLQGMESMRADESKLSDHGVFSTFPKDKQSRKYILYFQPDHFLDPPVGLLEEIEEQPDKLAVVDGVFGQIPSYPEMAIVGTSEGSELIVWDDESLDGFSSDNESVVSFRREYNLPMSLKERVYVHLLLPSLVEMVKNLSEDSPRSANAEPFWVELNEIMKDVVR